MEYGPGNEVTQLLDTLYNLLLDAKSVPFAKDKCMLLRESALGLLDEIKAQMPVEMAEARLIVTGRENYMANAMREAEDIVREAQKKQRQLIDEQELVKQANARAEEIWTDANLKAAELKRVANEYVDDALRRTEEAVDAALNEITQSRSRFRSLAAAQESETLTPAPVYVEDTPVYVEDIPEE